MWFAFGLITLIVGFAASWYARSQANWKGMPRALPDSRTYEYAVSRYKGRVTQIRIGLKIPFKLQFRIRKESWHDAFFKRIGVSVEMQVNDPSFDEAVYLESDVEALGQVLMFNEHIRSAIVRVFSEADAFGASWIRLRCSHGRVWVELSPTNNSAAESSEHALAEAVCDLAKGLIDNRVQLQSQHDPFVGRAIVVLSISTATAALGLLGLLRGIGGRTDIIDSGALFAACVVPGVLSLGVFVALIVKFLGRSSRAHLVLIEVIAIGGIGFVAGLFALAREFNIEFDSRPAAQIEANDVQIEEVVRRGRRGRKNRRYYLHLADWRESRHGAPLKIKLTSNQYSQLADTHNVLLNIRPGALGFAWIESIRPVYVQHPQ